MEDVSGPTTSENTNRLIARCLEAAAGRLDPESLRQALAACTEELSEAREAFYGQVKEEAGLVEALPEAIETVLDCFDAYGEALDEARTWLVGRRPEILQKAARSLAEAYTSLAEALLAYEWAYLGHGDEPHPALNLMQKVVAALRRGVMDDDRFDEVLDRMWDHFTQGIETFEQDADPLRANRGAQACRQALAGVQDMDMFLEEHDFEILQPGFTRFRQGCLLLVEQIQDSAGEALIQAPTPSPQVNWVIHAAKAVLDGLSPELLTRAQAWFEPQLAEAHFRFEQSAAAALKGSVRMAEQVPLARDGFAHLNRALPLLRLGLERRDLLPRAIEQLETGANLLHQAWTVLTELEEAESEAPCPRCGQPNPATQRVCQSCGATLVRAVAEAPPTPAPTGRTGPAHLARILTACAEAEAGRMPPQEFGAVLAWAEQFLKSAEFGLGRFPHEEPSPEVAEALQELRRGMAQFGEALEELREFTRDGRPVHLSTGTRLLLEACDHLAEAQGRARAS